MKPWGERKKTADQVARRTEQGPGQDHRVRAIASVRGPFQRGGGGGGRRHQRRPDRRRQATTSNWPTGEADPRGGSRTTRASAPATGL
ncbi:hypothetical protein ACRAWD_19420 [Caulobacter segnis]